MLKLRQVSIIDILNGDKEKLDVWNVLWQPFKHGHGSKNLMVSQCLQTSSGIQALHSTSQTITRTSTMRCGKVMPDCFNSKVFEVETDFVKIPIVLYCPPHPSLK